MKVRVTNGVVKDRETGRYCQPGDTLEVTKERYDELRAKGDYVVAVKSTGSDKKAADETESGAEQPEAPADPEPDPMPAAPLHSVEGVAYIEDIKKR